MAAVLLLVVLAQVSMLDTGLCGPPGPRLQEANSGLKNVGLDPRKDVSLEGVLELLKALDLVVKRHTKEASYNRSNTQQQENVTSHQPGRNMSKGHQNDALSHDQPSHNMSMGHQNYTPSHNMSKDYQNDVFSHDQPSHNMSMGHQNYAPNYNVSKDYQNDAFSHDKLSLNMNEDLYDYMSDDNLVLSSRFQNDGDLADDAFHVMV